MYTYVYVFKGQLTKVLANSGVICNPFSLVSLNFLERFSQAFNACEADCG